MKHTLTALVENKPGVLNRVVSLFRKRGFNIDSLTVGRTHDDNISRMTIVMEGDELDVHKVDKNLYKLVDVIQVDVLTAKPAVMRDLALIKVAVNSESRPEIVQLCEIFRSRIIDVDQNSIIVEVTGDEGKIAKFTDLMRPFGIIEMVRTGVVAMGRGDHTLKTDPEHAPRQYAVASTNGNGNGRSVPL